MSASKSTGTKRTTGSAKASGGGPAKAAPKTARSARGGSAARDQRKLDLAELRRLVNLMEQRELAEVEIELEGKRVRVVRAVPGGMASAALPAGYHGRPPGRRGPGRPGRCDGGRGRSERPAAAATEIPCPMVGTFYRASSPDAAPFVEVGDRVGSDTVVCIIEAMKVMNEVKADVSGEILEILVQNGEPVEFGQPLFLVRPTGAGA